MPKVKFYMPHIPGASDEAKDQLYGLIRKQIVDNASTEEARASNLEFFIAWWERLGNITIGQNTIDVQVLGGQDITYVCQALYHLAMHTGRVVTTSFNNTKIIMCDRGDYYG